MLHSRHQKIKKKTYKFLLRFSIVITFIPSVRRAERRRKTNGLKMCNHSVGEARVHEIYGEN
jgi:hypothetical protein